MYETIKQLIRRNPNIWRFAHRARERLKILLHGFSHPGEALLFFRVFPYTMVSYKRLANVYELAKKANAQNLEGAFVECGVWKGGAAAVMASAGLKNVRGSSRQIWLFDSFEGLPEPTLPDGERAREYAGNKASGKLSSIAKCVGPLEDVRHLFFDILRLPGENVHIERGWFQDTLPRAAGRVGPIAVLRLDADWYESTQCALEHLFDNVVLGGYVIVDDYFCWEGCKKAVDEFLLQRGLCCSLIRIDREGVYFKKS